jgi:hypothetical protein
LRGPWFEVIVRILSSWTGPTWTYLKGVEEKTNPLPARDQGFQRSPGSSGGRKISDLIETVVDPGNQDERETSGD